LECVDVPTRRGLWVSGPARVVVERGSLLGTGFVLDAGAEILVRGGRGSSLYALEDSRICLGLGAGGSYRLVGEGFELVEEWRRVLEELRSKGSRRVVVVGGVESGKSTLSAWAYNVLGLCVIESDVGQNELGTPAMVSFAEPGAGQVISLQDLVPSGGFFVGHVSAEKVIDLVIAASLRAARRCNTYVMDTDGFVESRGAIYKRALVEALEPDAVVVLGHKRLSEELRGLGVDVIPAPRVPEELARLRSRGDRRAYRQRLYASLFTGSKPVVLRGVSIEHLCPYTIGENQVIYTCGRRAFIESRYRAPPPAQWLRPGWAKGLLAGLRISGGDVLALVEDIDLAREKIVVRPARQAGNALGGVDSVILGWIRLREDLSEEHYQPSWYPEALVQRRLGRSVSR